MTRLSPSTIPGRRSTSIATLGSGVTARAFAPCSFAACSIAACFLALWPSVAIAGDTAELSAWSESAVEFLPAADGTGGVRARQRVGVNSPVGDDWQARADGAIRLKPTSTDSSTGDLYRLTLRRSLGDQGDVALGRMVRLDGRGFQHLDGFAAALGQDQPIRPSAWGGRAWHPDDLGAPNTWLGGVAVDLRPEGVWQVGGIGAQVGLEARTTEGRHGQRAHATAALRGARRGTAQATIEAGQGTESGTRAALTGTLPAGRRVDMRADLRWEDMPPADRAGLARSPIDWLGGDGYAVAALGTTVRHSRWRAMVNGGPAWHPSAEPDLGGMGRASVQATINPVHTAGVFASAGAIGGSWVSGGGVSGTRHHAALDLRADAGLFRFQGIDGVAGTVGEVRTRLSRPLDDHFLVAAELSAGANRQLAPYVSGGVVLQTRMGAPVGASR